MVGDAVFLVSELLSTAGLMTWSEASGYNHRVAREGAGQGWNGKATGLSHIRSLAQDFQLAPGVAWQVRIPAGGLGADDPGGNDEQ